MRAPADGSAASEEESCESGFECLPTDTQDIHQTQEAADTAAQASADENLTSSDSTAPGLGSDNNTAVVPSSLRGMRVGTRIGGFGRASLPPGVHPRPPIRPYHPYVHPWLYPRYPRVYGSAIACPCGISAATSWKRMSQGVVPLLQVVFRFWSALKPRWGEHAGTTITGMETNQ